MIASHPNTMMTSSSKKIRINEIPPFSPATQPGCSLSLRSRIFSSFWTAVSTSSSTASSGQGDHFFVFSSSTYKVVFKVPRPVPTSPELMLHWQSDARQQVFLKMMPIYMEEIKLGEDCHRISRFDTTEMSKILEDVLVLQLMLTELTWVIWITGVKRMVGWQEWEWRGWQGEWGWHGFIPCNVTIKCAKCAKY